ncbi:MAG: hypothetical protein KY440_03440 [Actinobacteria bacterium]|nr:hypothetical protein [Actinomycetota bacterium]
MSWTQARARVARLSQSYEPDDPKLIDARLELRTARAEEYLRNLLATAPPLSREQRDRLSFLLNEASA